MTKYLKRFILKGGEEMKKYIDEALLTKPLCELEKELGIDRDTDVIRDMGNDGRPISSYFKRESISEFENNFKRVFNKVTKIIASRK